MHTGWPLAALTAASFPSRQYDEKSFHTGAKAASKTRRQDRAKLSRTLVAAAAGDAPIRFRKPGTANILALSPSPSHHPVPPLATQESPGFLMLVTVWHHWRRPWHSPPWAGQLVTLRCAAPRPRCKLVSIGHSWCPPPLTMPLLRRTFATVASQRSAGSTAT
jgi:hypothetical protein